MQKHYTFLLTLLTLVFLNFQHSQAQTYVTIPDANFRAALKAKYPTCFNGAGQIDTQCGAVVNATYLYVGGKSIASLEGIQYFVNLKTLDCGYNDLSSLPALPTTLTRLECDTNELTSLPSLPLGLKRLNCNTNKLTSLPVLPSGLTDLLCYLNQLTSLPALPSSLIFLWCYSNQLTNLPSLPSTLTQFEAYYNCFTTTPTNPYPLTLTYFYVTPNNPGCTITATESNSETSTTLSLYPNPTEDKVSLSNAGEINKLELFNSYGQNVSVTLDKSTKEFSMEGLPSGIYTLSMVVDGKPVTMKVAKK